MKYFQFTVVVLVLISIFHFAPTVNSQDCWPHKTCGTCLRNPGCVWCKDPKFTIQNLAYTRCATMQEHRNASACPNSFLVELDPPTENAENSAPSSFSSITPKGYKIKLGVGQSVRLEMDYMDPGNKPLDLYYLMDLSRTMDDDRAAVVKLGQQLAGALQKTTKDLQIGFGSFVDKPMMPYSTLQQINLVETHNETKPYGFKNHLSLTTDHAKFEVAVKSAKISLNLDAPEGGLDAIMQAIVCKKEIGWRQEATRLLVLSTDGTFHIAGDGKLGGIITPNDGVCHMKDGQYTHSTILDYPSVSQIISKVKDELIFVIFAIVEQERALYEELARLLHPYASTIILNSRSTDVDKLVREQYMQIRSKLELRLLNKAGPSDIRKPVPHLELSYSAKCKPNEPFQEGTFKCEGVGPGAKLRFNIDVKLLSCPEHEEQWRTVFDISTTAATTTTGAKDKLHVEVELNCGCKCEKESESSSSQATCKGNGDIRCGVCACKTGYLGQFCQCQHNVTTTSVSGQIVDDDSKCKKQPHSPACSGRGKCNCGECTCDKGYKGEYCNCNANNCPWKNGEICSGHGHCPCEECVCDGQYKGPACDCLDSEESCKRPGSQTGLCSGGGQCKCNRCECEQGRSGKYCHICVEEKCPCMDEVRHYVMCAVTEFNSTHVQKQDKLKAEICANSTKNENMIYVEGLDVHDSIDRPSSGQRFCQIDDFPTRRSSDCRLHYRYSYNERTDGILIGVKKELTCPKPAATPLIVILATIFSILGIGILTLLVWKVMTYLHDKKEYTRFIKERDGAKFGQADNPLYEGAITTFKNPTYTE